jgi:hypothetical protein
MSAATRSARRRDDCDERDDDSLRPIDPHEHVIVAAVSEGTTEDRLSSIVALAR